MHESSCVKCLNSSCVDAIQAKTGLEGPEQAAVVRAMVCEYVRGLAWVMRYYYEGAHLASKTSIC